MPATAQATAAALYALLAVLAIAVLAILLTPVPSWTALSSTPGAALTTGALISLAVVSATLGIILWRGIRVPVAVVTTLALSLPVIAVAWNLIAPLLWAAPLFFVWKSSKTT